MEIPAERWHQALKVRKSRRTYREEEIEVEEMQELKEFTAKLNDQLDGVRMKIVESGGDEIYAGLVGSYGKIKGPSSFVVFIADSEVDYQQEKVGYLGEAFILEATAKELGTCWVGGFFKESQVSNYVNLKNSEEIIAVSPVGHSKENYSLAEKFISLVSRSRKRKSLDQLCEGGFKESWPTWVQTALKAARLAPSAVNRQPWRFVVKEDSIVVQGDDSTGEWKRLNCGIAMLHLEVGALKEGVAGRWEYLSAPQIAEFKVQK